MPPSPDHHHAFADALLACVGSAAVVGESALERLDDAGWRTLLPLLRYHGIAPYAAWHLRRIGFESRLPAGIAGGLAADFERNAACNLVVFAELDRILTACQTRSIPVIPLKGAYLARSIYADPALRQLGDLDLQVRHQDALAVAEVLRSAGYASAWKGDDGWKRRSCHLPPFTRPGGMAIEIHLDFNSPFTHFRTEDDLIWGRARPDPGRLPNCLALETEDLVLYLCLHLYRARLRVGLRHLLDIRELLTARGADIRGAILLERARKWNMERIVWVTLAMAADLFRVDSPTDLTELSADYAADRKLLQGARNRIFSRGDTYSWEGLLFLTLRRLTVCRGGQEFRIPEPYPDETLKPSADKPSAVRKLKLVAGAGATFLGFLVRQPRATWRTLCAVFREARFDRWMRWP